MQYISITEIRIFFVNDSIWIVINSFAINLFYSIITYKCLHIKYVIIDICTYIPDCVQVNTNIRNYDTRNADDIQIPYVYWILDSFH